MKKIRFYTAGAMELTEDAGTSWRYRLDEIIKNDTFLSEHMEVVHPEIPLTAEEAQQEEWKVFLETLDEQKQAFYKSFYQMPNDLPELANILAEDWETIRTSDALLCFVGPNAAKSTGTISEMSIAYTHNIPYYTWVNTSLMLEGPHRIWTASVILHSSNVYRSTPTDEAWKHFLTISTLNEINRKSKLYKRGQ
jgi:hypothetical protein